jgi:hypothetical protein
VTGTPFDSNPIGERTVDELLRMATEFDLMAASAATLGGKQALEGLAARLRTFAVMRATAPQTKGQVVRPGEPAPVAGHYELRNVFGTWVGDIARVRQGGLLPRAPQEFTWHLTAPLAPSCGFAAASPS